MLEAFHGISIIYVFFRIFWRQKKRRNRQLEYHDTRGIKKTVKYKSDYGIGHCGRGKGRDKDINVTLRYFFRHKINFDNVEDRRVKTTAISVQEVYLLLFSRYDPL